LGIDFSLLHKVERIVQLRKKRFLADIRSVQWTLRGKRLAVLGLASKGDTNDIPDSSAIELVKVLLKEDCSIIAYDPTAMRHSEVELPSS
jgi:UDPglucose 6-dehydrogenase